MFADVCGRYCSDDSVLCFGTVSEEYAASIFMDDTYFQVDTAVILSALKTEAAHSSKTLLSTHKRTCYQNAKDCHLSVYIMSCCMLSGQW